jgi:uncharacterized protein YraI
MMVSKILPRFMPIRVFSRYLLAFIFYIFMIELRRFERFFTEGVNSMRKLITLTTVLIISVLFLSACAAGSESATADPEAVSAQVNATLTALAPGTSTPTPEPSPTEESPPTAEPTLIPTQIPPTPTLVPVEGDPAAILGEASGVDYFDTFNNWTNFDNECFKSEINGIYFLMTAKGLAGVACWEFTWPLLENFYLETVIEMPQSCQADDRFGVIFRAPDNNQGYLYGYTCDGRFTLTAWDGDETTTVLVPITETSTINTSPGAQNRMGVLVMGEDYYLYANGLFLAQAEDLTYLEPGKIGYYVRAATEEPFTVAYDHLKIWVLEDDFYPPQVTPPPLPTAPVETPAPNVPTGTSTVNLNVRSGPGLQFAILGTVEQGTTGEILGLSPDGAWYAVKVPTSLSGNGQAWVMGRYVTLSNPTGQPLPTINPPLLPSKASVPQPGANDPQVTMLETATIRQGPSVEYPVFGVTPEGAKAIVVGESEDGQWWAIKLETQTGWVYKGYTYAQKTDDVPVIKNPDLPGSINPSVPGSGAAAAVALEPINVRSGPSNTYDSYGKISIGTSLALIGRSADSEWLVVNLPTDIAPDGRGWVAARYVHAENISSLPVIQAP